MLYGYVVFDEELKKYTAPVFFENDGLAIRWYSMQVAENLKNPAFRLILPKLSLRCICSFNPDTASVESMSDLVITGSELLEELGDL